MSNQLTQTAVDSVDASVLRVPHEVKVDFNKKGLEDVGFLTSMYLVLLGNYSQTGHFGGPLSYTPANVAIHLGGPEYGGLRYDIRNPKHPFTDKFLLAGGHCVPTCYALWTVLYEAMLRQFKATNDPRYQFDPKIGFFGIDGLGFRRSPGAVKTLLKKLGVEDHPAFQQAKIRGIRALMGHSESTDATNDVNGGPSGIGVAKAAGKAMFWDMIGAPEDIKVIAFEGEFAFTEGHAQELKTMALAQQVGKRLRLFFSNNNAGIDDAMMGGVINQKYTKYDFANQFVSYGWNVFHLPDGADYNQLLAVFKKMEEWPAEDRRPMVVIADTIKGWWPAAADGMIGSNKQIIGYPSHPYAFKLNSEYFITLAESFEKHYGVRFVGIRDGVPKTEKEKYIQFATNLEVCLSVIDKKPGLRQWITDRLLSIANTVTRNFDRLIFPGSNPFHDERLKLANIPMTPQKVMMRHPDTGKEITKTITLFEKSGTKLGARRAISEIGKWINYVTNNRWVTVAADLSNSINLEEAHFTGHYDPVTNRSGTRLKAGIQECVNAATVAGLASQTVSQDPNTHIGYWGVTGTYGAFTPLMYLPLRIFSQQNQDSPFALGVVTVVAGHSGPETAADARSHFGIFSPQVWSLFPRGQIINLFLWDYNDVAPAYFRALHVANTKKETAIIVIHVARPDTPVADRNTFADTDIKASAKGCYLIRDYDKNKPYGGTIFLQGSSSTVNTVSLIPTFEKEDLNVRVVAVISEDLFRLQPQEYQDSIYPLSARYDCMVITSMTKRINPLPGMGPLTEEYSLSSDFDDRWRSGGSEADVIEEARLDNASILKAVRRFVGDRQKRLQTQSGALSGLCGACARL